MQHNYRIQRSETRPFLQSIFDTFSCLTPFLALSSSSDLSAALANQDALVYVASLGFGHADGVVSALVENHISRAVFSQHNCNLHTAQRPQ